MPIEAVLKDIDGHHLSVVDALASFVRIASVHADPAHAGDVRDAADWLVARMTKAGLSVQRLETAGAPIVFAVFEAPGPRILVYGHYDVQPAGGAWRDGPFSGAIRDGAVWGRGASDDKGQLLCHLAAFEAWQRQGGPPCAVAFVVEGEEESGSTHFRSCLDAVKEFGPDVVVASDTSMRDAATPSLGTSLRGILHLRVTVRTAPHDLHSGVFGGVVMNAVEEAARLVASLREGGRIAVAGFDVPLPDDARRARLASEGMPDTEIEEQAGTPLISSEHSAQERIGWLPSLDVHGIRGGHQGPGTKTVIPATAEILLSARLVAGQDGPTLAKAIISSLRQASDAHIEAEVLRWGPAVTSDPDHPAMVRIASALAAEWGRPPALIPEGGTIQGLGMLQEAIPVPIALVGLGLRSDGMHAPDEHFRVDQLRRGTRAAARVLA